jgi:flagellar protein FlaG
MNSEITNVSKLVPLTVLSNKQNNLKMSSSSEAKDPQAVVEPTEDSSIQTAALKADNQDASLELVKSAAAKGNSILQATNRDLEFQVDESTKKVVVKIIDSKTGDVVRQVPSEDMMAFIKRMQDLEGNHGAMLQDKA